MTEQVRNKKLKDSTSKLIFGDAILCAQFMRDYLDIPILKNVRPEDIEDVSQRYVPLFTSEREADTVKRVKLSDTESLFFITLIEHKTEVDYNVVMQLFRYMCYIWEDYEKEVCKQYGINSNRKEFKYPPILPIVYYEGKGDWTAVTNFKERVFLSEIFSKYTPDFSYELISLQKYSSDQLIKNKDEISLIMLLNRLQDAAELKDIPEIAKLGKEVWENTPEYLLEIIAKITTALLYRLNVPQEEVDEAVSRIKERKMPVLFEHFKGYDIQATRKEARAEGIKEGTWRLQITLVCRKLQKNLTVSQIADALEMEEKQVADICTIAEKYAPAYDVECILKEVMELEGRAAITAENT